MARRASPNLRNARCHPVWRRPTASDWQAEHGELDAEDMPNGIHQHARACLYSYQRPVREHRKNSNFQHPVPLQPEMKPAEMVLRKLKDHAMARPFLLPVDPLKLGIPDYFDIVKHPMDLQTLTNNLNHGKYVRMEDFERDLQLIWDNCFLYNPPTNEVVRMATVMEYYSKKLLASVWEAKGLSPGPSSTASTTQSHLPAAGSKSLDQASSSNAARLPPPRRTSRPGRSPGGPLPTAWPTDGPAPKRTLRQADTDDLQQLKQKTLWTQGFITAPATPYGRDTLCLVVKEALEPQYLPGVLEIISRACPECIEVQGTDVEIDFQLLDDQTLFALQLYAADCLARQRPRPLLRGREAPRLASEALLDVFEPPACPAAEPPAPAQAEAEAEVARPRSKRRALSPAGRRSAQQGRAVGAADPAVVAPRRPSRRPASPGAAPTAEEWLEPGEPRRGRPRRDRVVRRPQRLLLEEEDGEAESWPEPKPSVREKTAGRPAGGPPPLSPPPSGVELHLEGPGEAVAPHADVPSADVDTPAGPLDNLPGTAADTGTGQSPTAPRLPAELLNGSACLQDDGPFPPSAAPPHPPSPPTAPAAAAQSPPSPASAAPGRAPKALKAAKLRKAGRVGPDPPGKLGGALQALQEQVLSLARPLPAPDPNPDPWLKPLADPEYLTLLQALPPQPFVPPLPAVQMSSLSIPAPGLPPEPHPALHQYLLQQQQLALYEAQQQHLLHASGLLSLPSPHGWATPLFTTPAQPPLLPPHMQMLLLDQQPLQDHKRFPPPMHGPPVAPPPTPADLA